MVSYIVYGGFMNIIIMGAGKVGQVLCNDLSLEDHNITLIEKNANKLDQMLNDHDINGILGNGADVNIQLEAGIENADIFVAVTNDDELNMIASVLAKSLGAKHILARVRKEEYSHLSKIIRESLGISYILNPELQTAEYVKRLINFPQAISYESFTTNKAPIVQIKVENNSNLVGKMLVQFRNEYKNLIVCAATKGNEVFIPKGDFAISPGVHLFVTGPFEEMKKLFKENGQDDTKINSIFIVGGGLITRYMLSLLNNSKIKIKVMELNREKAEYLSERFPKVEVINDDGTSIQNLKEQRADKYDAFFALTGIDEENIIVSMIGRNLGIKKILTKISRTELYEFGDMVGLDSIVTPKRIVADSILQKVRAWIDSEGSDVEALYTLVDNQILALQFLVKSKSKLTNNKIKDLPIKEGNLIAYIIRNGQVVFPSGNDEIMINDRVLIITQNNKISELDEILR